MSGIDAECIKSLAVAASRCCSEYYPLQIEPGFRRRYGCSAVSLTLPTPSRHAGFLSSLAGCLEPAHQDPMEDDDSYERSPASSASANQQARIVSRPRDVLFSRKLFPLHDCELVGQLGLGLSRSCTLADGTREVPPPPHAGTAAAPFLDGRGWPSRHPPSMAGRHVTCPRVSGRSLS